MQPVLQTQKNTISQTDSYHLLESIPSREVIGSKSWRTSGPCWPQFFLLCIFSNFFFLNHCSDSNVCKLDLVAMTDPKDEQVKGWQANFGSWLQFGIAGSIFPCWKACLQQRRLWGLLIFKPEHHPVGQMMSFGLDFYFSDLFDHLNIFIFENVYSDDLFPIIFVVEYFMWFRYWSFIGWIFSSGVSLLCGFLCCVEVSYWT